MLLYAGMDWASYRKPHRQILVASLVAVSDLEALATAVEEARIVAGLPKNHVFHAYTDAPHIQLALLQSVLRGGMTLRVGAVIYDSAGGVQEIFNRLSVNDFTHYMGISLLKEFLAVYPLEKLVSDSEIEGRKQETKFKKEVRTLRDLGYFTHAPEIEFGISKKSQLIQVADLLGYNLYRSQRDALELPAMQELVKAIYKDSNNIIREFRELEARR